MTCSNSMNISLQLYMFTAIVFTAIVFTAIHVCSYTCLQLYMFTAIRVYCYLLRTSLRIALDVVAGVFLPEPGGDLDCSVGEAKVRNVSVSGDPGLISMWEFWAPFATEELVGIATCLGAVKGLNGVLCASFCFCWTSLTISSAGSLTVGGGGDDSRSKNFTNIWEKDWK